MSWGPHGRFTLDSARQRFLDRLDRSGECWPWTGARNRGGYGILGFQGKSELAHRVAMVLLANRRVAGFSVMHHCDNPPCCNPAHLFLGVQADNVADMERKRRGRHPRGAKHGRAKLTWEQVGEIRA